MSESATQEIQEIKDEGLDKGAEKLTEDRIQQVINKTGSRCAPENICENIYSLRPLQ